MDKYIAPSKLQRGDVIGSGAFGIVQRGKFLSQSGIWQDVAIKQSMNDSASPLSSSSGPTPDEEFVKEVSVTVDISGRAHHIVQCMGWSVVGEGQFALVMKLYDKSLYKLIDERVGDGLPLVLVVKIGLHVARGMLELHTEHIVFEDLKPHNVLLDVEENAFLADFGLCKQVKDLSKVYTSNVGGTYLFMAPEKLGPPSGDKLRVGFASDVWAFGITMLQLLCCDTMAPYGRGISLPNIIMMLMVDRQAPRVPAVPSAPELQHTLQACLSLDYKERPSAAQLVQAFEGILSRLQSPASSSDAAAQGSSITRALNTQSAAPATRPLHLLSSPTCSATLTGQRKDVRSVAFTPDGATLVSGSFDNTIKLWDVASGSCRATLEGHTKRVRSVAVSKDGCTLVSGSDDRTARLWDLGSCRLTATLSDHTGWVFSVAISPDNATVASGSEDKTVRLWDARSGSHKATLQGHSAFVYCVAFSVDGTRLASGGGPGDATVRLWDTSSTSCVATLKGHTSAVRDVVFSQDGAALLSASDDSTVWVWDAQTGASMKILQGHTSGVCGVVLMPDGAYAASGSEDKTIKVWDLKGSGECVATLRGHGGIVWSVAVSPDGRRLASGSRDQNIKLWRIPE